MEAPKKGGRSPNRIFLIVIYIYPNAFVYVEGRSENANHVEKLTIWWSPGPQPMATKSAVSHRDLHFRCVLLRKTKNVRMNANRNEKLTTWRSQKTRKRGPKEDPNLRKRVVPKKMRKRGSNFGPAPRCLIFFASKKSEGGPP